MKRIIYRDKDGKIIHDAVVLSPEEVRNAAITMYNQNPLEFDSARDLHGWLCYLLGARYWGYDYSWEACA